MKTSIIHFRVSEEDKNRIELLARQSSSSSVSEYIRLCALNKKVKNNFDHEVAMELLKVNADLAKLGNLFRLSLKENNKYDAKQLDVLQKLIQEACQNIRSKVLSL